MKPGTRKFYGFIITLLVYTAVLITVALTYPAGISDVSAFAVQSSIGYCGIAGLFFAGNVAEHFANKGKNGNEIS